MDKHLHVVNRRVEGRVVYTAFFPGNRCDPLECLGAAEEKARPTKLEETPVLKVSQRL